MGLEANRRRGLSLRQWKFLVRYSAVWSERKMGPFAILRRSPIITGGQFILSLVLSLSARGVEQSFFYPPQSQHEELRNWGQVKRLISSYNEMLGQSDAADTIAKHLLETTDQEELNACLLALGYSFEQTENLGKVVQVFDQLDQRDDLSCTILAADVLLKAIMAADPNHRSTKFIRAFPDEACDRAADLLDHPDPVVRAMAEWTLALRVKKQNSRTLKIDELMLPGQCEDSWYRKWLDRQADHNLCDDYCRQLIQLNRHHTISDLETDVEKVERRMTRLLAARGSDTSSDEVTRRRTVFLEAMQKMRAAIVREDLISAHQSYPTLRESARDVIVACRGDFPREGVVFFTNYCIPGGVWNVNVPVTGTTNIPFGDLYWKAGSAPTTEAAAFGLKEKIGEGSVRGIDLSWEADKVLFSYWLQPIDGSQPYGWNPHRNAHIFEMDVRTQQVRQLTSSPGDNDIEPCFLPDGTAIFASDRSSFGNQCAGPFLQDKRCTTLFRIDPRRSERPVAISNNKDFDRHPHILNDGTVVFMHWEYQERDLYQLQNAWRCRPDGTNMDAFYKQHISVPYSIRDVQQAPDSPTCVATAQGHHDAHNGPVILFNPSLGINNPDTLQLVTPGTASVEGGLGPLYRQVVPEGGVENRGGSYINPFPLSEKAFLVSHDLEGIGLYQASPGESEFAVYYIDVWGNRELIHRDKHMSCFMPHPLRPRKRPPVVADAIDPQATFATAFVENVYRDLPGVKPGAVKFLRINQRLMLPAPVDYNDPEFNFNHLHWLPGDATAVHFGYWTFAPTRTIGIVTVDDNGSAYFKVPAGTPVYLQALDENYCEVRRMRTSFTLQRGEFRGCVGCHESRVEAVVDASNYPRTTMGKSPQTPEPPAWGDCEVLDYRRHIQPVFDVHCVRCHGQENPDAGIDLTGRPVAGFTQSYRSLFGIRPKDPQIVNELDWHQALEPEAKDENYVDGKEGSKAIKLMQQNQWPGMLVSISDKNSRDADVTRPYQFGSNQSKLIRVLLDDDLHRKEVWPRISRDDWLKLVTWIDQNANYHSTLVDKSKWNTGRKLIRVPYQLPSPWEPADLKPSFHNQTVTTNDQKG